jgi:lipid-binding SYLF domain-containing protein
MRRAVALLGLGTAAGWLLAAAPSPVTANEKQDRRDQEDVQEVITKLKEKDPELGEILAHAVGWAVFPTVGKGGLGIGAARGKGLVYEHGRWIGRTTLTQVSIGLQFGGQAYSEVVLFETQRALDNFKKGHLKLDAQASAVALSARAAKDVAYRNGVAIVTMAKGGLMYEASVGGQKFSFKPLLLDGWQDQE